jgi:hypothetical protein
MPFRHSGDLRLVIGGNDGSSQRFGHVFENFARACNFRAEGVDAGLLRFVRRIAGRPAERADDGRHLGATLGIAVITLLGCKMAALVSTGVRPQFAGV